MSERTSVDWSVWNQRRLTAEVARIRELLQRKAGVEDGPAKAPGGASGDGSTALDVLVSIFGLSDFERDIVLLCAAVELDARVAPLCGQVLGDPRRAHPTFGLALSTLGGAHWSALVPGGPLRYWRLVETAGAEPLTMAPLRIDERILHYLTGINELDDRLNANVRAVVDPARLTPSQAASVDRIVNFWDQQPIMARSSNVLLCGPDGAAREGVAAAACGELGYQLYRVRPNALPGTPEEREAFARLWDRESLLRGAALLLDRDDHEAADGIGPLLQRITGRLLVSSAEPTKEMGSVGLRVDVGKPTPDEQRDLWRTLLGETADRLNGRLGEVVAQFDLPSETILAVSRRLGIDGDDEASVEDRIWSLCRSHARPSLDDLATRIETEATWDDLVLPEAQRKTLTAIASHVRHRERVYLKWSFARRSSRGLGISALFSGPSGTGKTLAAEVLANDLQLDLYHIDLSSVVSKYIGETEKNLRRVFDAAEDGGAILLFDEADAIFGKRSEVKDSHDRYANLEVSYLLQRMEAYRGLAILTTNFQDALDSAFMRRIRFVVHFPFPDAEHRSRIWRGIFPAETPTAELNASELARLNVTGGNIRNIALGAAFIAADEGEPIRMDHILRAARDEYAKLERPLSETEIAVNR